MPLRLGPAPLLPSMEWWRCIGQRRAGSDVLGLGASDQCEGRSSHQDGGVFRGHGAGVLGGLSSKHARALYIGDDVIAHVQCQRRKRAGGVVADVVREYGGTDDKDVLGVPGVGDGATPRW